MTHGLVRLTYVQGVPAVVLRDHAGRLHTLVVASHAPYKRANALAVRRRLAGVNLRLSAYDRGDVS